MKNRIPEYSISVWLLVLLIEAFVIKGAYCNCCELKVFLFIVWNELSDIVDGIFRVLCELVLVEEVLILLLLLCPPFILDIDLAIERCWFEPPMVKAVKVSWIIYNF